jgi:hypothetical protein
VARYGPDPLSARYEQAAARFLGEAVAGKGRWHYRGITRPDDRGAAQRAWLARNGIALDETDSGGLTRWERAYQRALYRVAKQLGISTPDGHLSLQREWGPDTAHGRLLGIKVTAKTVALRAVARKPRRDRYTENPALRSGGEGSPQQKYG